MKLNEQQKSNTQLDKRVKRKLYYMGKYGMMKKYKSESNRTVIKQNYLFKAKSSFSNKIPFKTEAYSQHLKLNSFGANSIPMLTKFINPNFDNIKQRNRNLLNNLINLISLPNNSIKNLRIPNYKQIGRANV